MVRTPRTAVSVHQQRVHREAGEQVHAELFGALAEPADDLAERRGVVARVVHRRRRGDPLRPALGHEVDRLAGNGLAEGKVGRLHDRERARARRGGSPPRRRDCARPGSGLLEHADVEVGQPPPLSWSRFASWASSIAQASPAGPAPTISTSISIASAPGGSRRMRRSSGSGGWWMIGRMVDTTTPPGGPSGSAEYNRQRGVAGRHRASVTRSSSYFSRMTTPAIPGFRSSRSPASST